MSEENSEDESSGWRESLSGVRDVFRSGAENASTYLRARSALLKLEAEEAAAAGKSIGAICGAGAALLVAGYTMLFTGVLLLCFGSDAAAWIWLAGAGLVHLVVGAIVLAKGRKRQRETRWFSESLEQWKRDQEWLEKTLKRSRREKPGS